MNGIGWITVAEAARLCGTDELRITLWMNGNHIAYARFDRSEEHTSELQSQR